MTANLAKTQPDERSLEAVLGEGNLQSLTTHQRVQYLQAVCQSLGLNPLTRPFQFLRLNGELRMYATKDCTEQLRSLKSISLSLATPEEREGVLFVRATAKMPNGRSDESLGAVTIQGLRGEALANAYMKAETKAKRRVTLSICGLGLLDESEVSAIPGAERVEVPADVEPEAPARHERPADSAMRVGQYRLAVDNIISQEEWNALSDSIKANKAIFTLDELADIREFMKSKRKALKEAPVAMPPIEQDPAMDVGADPGGLAPPQGSDSGGQVAPPGPDWPKEQEYVMQAVRDAYASRDKNAQLAVAKMVADFLKAPGLPENRANEVRTMHEMARANAQQWAKYRAARP